MNQKIQNTLVVVLILLVGFVAFFKMGTALAWGIIPAIIAVPWMLGDPKRLLAGYWLWATISEYAYQVTGVGILRYGDEVLLCTLLIALVFIQALNRKPTPDLRGMSGVFWGLVVLLGLSHMVNRGDNIDAAVTVVQYLRPFILGFFAYLVLRVEDLHGLSKFLLFTLFIQLAMNLAWLLELNPFPHPGIFVGIDFAVGTMGSALYVGYTACLGIVLCVAVFVVLRSTAYLVAAALLAVSFVFTSTAHAYAFLALMLLAMALVYSRGVPTRLVGVLLAGVPIISVIVLIQVVSPLTLRLDTYLKRGNDLLTGRKIAAYKSHLLELPREDSIPFFMLGTGPGTLGTAMADERGYLAAKYHGWSFTGADALEVQTGSIIMVTRTAYLAVWSDFGPIAFLLYWGSHVAALIRVLGFYRKNAYQHPWQRAFALSFIPVMMLYLAVAFMTDIVHTALWGCIPWTWAAIVWSPIRVEEELDELASEDAPAGVILQPLVERS